MNDLVQVKADELINLGCRIFERAGLAADRARVAARILVDTEMMGIATHGAARLVSYSARMHHGGIDPSAEITVEQTGAIAGPC